MQIFITAKIILNYDPTRGQVKVTRV